MGGLIQSFMKYSRANNAGVKPERIRHTRSVSLVVEGDWVSRFDTHAGFVQTVSCDRDDLALFGGCHLLESTICHILNSCGDVHGRWQRCEHSFQPHLEAWSLVRD